MMTLYGMSASGHSYKVKLMLEQEGIAYRWVEVDIRNGDSRTPEFLAKNPCGKVPVLEIAPGEYLYESNAILTFLARGTHYWPDPAFPHAKVMEWMFFEQSSHMPYLAPARFINKFLGADDARRAELPTLLEKGYKALDIMERQLEKSLYLVNSHYCIADNALFAYTHIAHEGGFDMSRYPAIHAWIERVTQTPGFVAM